MVSCIQTSPFLSTFKFENNRCVKGKHLRKVESNDKGPIIKVLIALLLKNLFNKGIC
jgi:hypothetical protein